MSIVYLLEAGSLTPVTFAPKTWLFSTTPGYNQLSGLGFYEPDLITPANITRAAFSQAGVLPSQQLTTGPQGVINQGTVQQQASFTWGTVQVKNVAPDLMTSAPYDAFPDYGFDGQMARLLMIDTEANYSTAIVLAVGTIEQPYDDMKGTITFTFHDQTLALDLPLMPTAAQRFKGTNTGATGVEGTAADLLGTPYPYLFGWAPNFTPSIANSVALVYQLSYRQIVGVCAVYDKGGVIKPGVHRASLAALISASPTSGTYDYYLGSGSDGAYVKLGTTPSGTITCTAIGDVGASTQKISNGDFLSGTNWTAGSGWSITGGYAVATTCSATLTQSITGLIVGHEYCVSGTLSNVSAGSLSVALDALAGGASGLVAGDFQLFFTATGTSHTLTFTGAALTGVLANVSMAAATVVDNWKNIISVGVVGASVSSTDVTYMNGVQGGICGWYAGSDTTVRSILDPIAQTTYAFYNIDKTGTWRFTRLEAPETKTALCRVLYLTGVDALLTDCNIIDIDREPVSYAAGDPNNGVPAGSVVVNYNLCWTVQTADSLVTNAQPRAAFTSQQYRSTAPQVNAAVKSLHLFAPQITVNTLWASSVTATAEALRLATLFGVRRDLIKVVVQLSTAFGTSNLDLGSIVQLIIQRGRYSTGVNQQIISILYDATLNQITSTQWG